MTVDALVLAPLAGMVAALSATSRRSSGRSPQEGVDYRRIDLQGSGPAAHGRMLSSVSPAVARERSACSLVVAHSSITAGSVADRQQAPRMWRLAHVPWDGGVGSATSGLVPLERYLMRRHAVRVVAVSSFTAGVLSRDCQAAILPPGLSQEWFDTLLDASDTVPRRDTESIWSRRFAWRIGGTRDCRASAGRRQAAHARSPRYSLR